MYLQVVMHNIRLYIRPDHNLSPSGQILTTHFPRDEMTFDISKKVRSSNLAAARVIFLIDL